MLVQLGKETSHCGVSSAREKTQGEGRQQLSVCGTVAGRADWVSSPEKAMLGLRPEGWEQLASRRASTGVLDRWYSYD